MSDDHHIPTAAHDLNPEPGERLARPFQRFASLSSSGGIILLLMTAIAMIWANKDYDSYKEIFNDTEIRITVADNPHDTHSNGHDEGHGEDDGHDNGNSYGNADGHDSDHAEEMVSDVAQDPEHATDHADDDHAAADAHGDGWHPLPKKPHWYQGLSMVHWINDLLMAVFFLVVGLEIKREILVGELASPKRAALPIFGALGGMIGPALIFVSINFGKETIGGWGIPMATDIAFAVGVVSLLGDRVPSAMKVFLLTLAIVDDIGAIAVIAIFYTDDFSSGWFLVAILSIGVVLAMRIVKVWWIPLYVLVGSFVWHAVFESGIHATIAGVILGVITPAKPLMPESEAYDIDDVIRRAIRGDASAPVVRRANFELKERISVVDRLEDVLHPFSSYVIIPIFALANAGVMLSGETLSDAVSSPVTLGVVFGLVVGKLVGISFFTMIAVKSGIAPLPRTASWIDVVGLAAIAGIGFTVSLFITGLAFDDHAMQDTAKIGVLTASVLAAAAGAYVLKREAARVNA